MEVTEIFQFTSLIEWHSIRTPLLAGALVIVGGVGIGIKCLFINYIWRHAPPNRPINSLILKDQVLLLIATLILGLGNLISLISQMSLYEIFGDQGCFVFWAGLWSFGFITFTSSFSMSLFRWICIIHLEEAYLMGMEKIKRFVNITEGTIYVLALPFGALTYIYGKSHLSMTFCYNKSKTFLDVLANHNEPIYAYVGQLALIICLNFLLVLAVLEFLMYAILFKTLWSHDQKIKDSVSNENIQKRNKTNVITLSGQAWGFVIEIVTNIILQVTINLDSDSVFLQTQIATFYCVMMSTAVSVGQFLTSPDMRKFYLKHDP